ncbi:uncharacterized protein FIBRA_04120 [Fibroporia radiculosa]|uniref:Uncharacterized protein n=1 Tax=Fibroporia radiculosa TaxID=599839 RepID=J4H2S7_9APHY|nr:uncharacterized protein FIBRA_04120 [Fibroporia radiculosa]CCM02044.1 predicted protein [Fibroporia radiculosa]
MSYDAKLNHIAALNDLRDAVWMNPDALLGSGVVNVAGGTHEYKYLDLRAHRTPVCPTVGSLP